MDPNSAAVRVEVQRLRRELDDLIAERKEITAKFRRASVAYTMHLTEELAQVNKQIGIVGTAICALRPLRPKKRSHSM